MHNFIVIIFDKFLHLLTIVTRVDRNASNCNVHTTKTNEPARSR